MDSDFVHGSSSSYRKCTDAPGSKPCEQCITGRREADTRRQQRKRDRERLAAGVTEPMGKPVALRLVTNATAGHDVPEASRADPAASPAASRTPVPAARGGSKSRAAEPAKPAEFDMPRLWSTAASEPDYAETHRQWLAWYAEYATDNPDTVYTFPPDDIGSKQEAKDIARLLKEFRSANPGLIDFRGDSDSQRWFTYYKYDLYSAEYMPGDDAADDDTVDDESEDKAEPAFEMPARQPSQSREPASKPARQPSTPKPVPGAPLVYPFQSATGICKINVAGEPQCINTADGSLWFDDKPICGAHASYLAQWYSGRITRKRNANGTQSAASSRAPFRIVPSAHGMCQVMMQQDANTCSRYAGESVSEAQYTVDNHPVCQDHYNSVRAIGPERCQYVTNGQWFMAPHGIQYG